jgi:hypothetical protein
MDSRDRVAVLDSVFEEQQGNLDCCLKPFESWEDGLTFYRHTFAEDYRSGKLSLILYLRAISIDQVQIGDSLICAVLSAIVPNLGYLHLRDHELMLVEHVDLMEMVEAVPYNIRSLVRLYCIEQFPANGDNGILLFSGLEKTYKVLPGWVDRELDLVDFLGISISSGNLIPSHVQGSSKIMNGIPANQGEAILMLLDNAKFLDHFSGLGVSLCSGGIRSKFSTEMFRGVRLEIAHVLCGPFDL